MSFTLITTCITLIWVLYVFFTRTKGQINVDTSFRLNDFLGTWNIIASYGHKPCTGEPNVQYALQEKNLIQVSNYCTQMLGFVRELEEGKYEILNAPADVAYFTFLWESHWILYSNPTLLLLSTKDKTKVWVLSKSKNKEQELTLAFDKLTDNGYNKELFITY